MNIPDTQEMIQRASQIRSIAEDINRLNNVSLKNASDSIHAIWRGEAANAYLRHCAMTRDLVHETTSELQSIANEMERIARHFEPAGNSSQAIN